MAIANFPTQLQSIIQQGFLAREFEDGLQSRLGYRAIADREVFPARIGQTITMTRKGLKAPVTTPLNPSSDTNFDNGLTPTSWGTEQYTVSINRYADTIDLNIVDEGVGIADQFLANAKTNGIQSAQSLDRLSRNALFAGNTVGIGGYLSGNTRVLTTLGSPGTAVHVDDITGFQNVMTSTGLVVPVSGSYPLAVTIGAGGDIYMLSAATADGTNISTAPFGVSGTLTFTGNVTVADATAGQPVVSATAPLIVRPNGKLTAAALVAPQNQYNAANYVPGDTLGIQDVLTAVAALRSNNVPTIDGMYNCYISDAQLLKLYRDADFKQLFRGDFNANAYVNGVVVAMLGVRFVPTTEAPIGVSLGQGLIQNAIVCGAGALIEADYLYTNPEAPTEDGALVENIDTIRMVTREPMDRLHQIIAQSWQWIGGFCIPTDYTANSTIIPTASNSYLKRAVCIQSL